MSNTRLNTHESRHPDVIDMILQMTIAIFQNRLAIVQDLVHQGYGPELLLADATHTPLGYALSLDRGDLVSFLARTATLGMKPHAAREKLVEFIAEASQLSALNSVSALTTLIQKLHSTCDQQRNALQSTLFGTSRRATPFAAEYSETAITHRAVPAA